jgi:Cys-tRNA(Pro)/Cys-tRNA(Cys) deacylase
MPGGGTRALDELRRAGVAHAVHEYEPAEPSGRARDARPHYGEAAAAALGVDPRRIHKTLVASLDGRLVVAVVPVAAELDLKALADALGGRKAAMADPAEAERATGYVRGGISPLGQRRRLPTVIDAAALDWPTIHVSAGRRGLQVELAPADLVRLTAAVTAPIARG